MEKRSENIRIAITGPESTGKTTISSQLSQHFSGSYVPEYARDYILNLNRKYEYQDIEHIAEMQIESFIQANSEDSEIIFFDTWLIITKVWFQEVFGKCPDRIANAIQKYKIDFYLLCAPDIDWVKDEVRENGGERRHELFNIYREEIEKLHIPYKIIQGKDETRFRNALEAVNTFLEKDSISNKLIRKP